MSEYRYRSEPKKCPACKSTRVATILYGMPVYTHGLQKEIDEGKTVLGGCSVPLDGPTWQCADCEVDIYKIHYYVGPGLPPIAP